MSIKTWKEKHYPITAREACKNKSEIEAVEHCIQKWKGLSSAQLKKHELSRDCAIVMTLTKHDTKKEIFCVNALTCALCVMHKTNCNKCVLYKIGYGCMEYGSPYDEWMWEGTQARMLKALRKCLIYLNQPS